MNQKWKHVFDFDFDLRVDCFIVGMEFDNFFEFMQAIVQLKDFHIDAIDAMWYRVCPHLQNIEKRLIQTRVDLASAIIKVGVDEPQFYIDELPTVEDFYKQLQTYKTTLEEMLQKMKSVAQQVHENLIKDGCEVVPYDNNGTHSTTDDNTTILANFDVTKLDVDKTKCSEIVIGNHVTACFDTNRRVTCRVHKERTTIDGIV